MNRFLLLHILFAFSMTVNCSAPFVHLSDAQSYAAAHPEYVKPTNDDWVHPDFKAFHKKQLPRWYGRVLSWFGVSNKKFNISAFQTLLSEVTHSREDKKVPTAFCEQYSPSAQDHFIIFTDLFGAFHSFVRDLTFLQKEGVLDNSFKIIKPGYHFVFNGNVIDGSPYILETLALVLQLMRVNPSQVIYTQGSHEIKDRWHNFELLSELKIRASAHFSGKISLSDMLTRFFSTLPMALYLTQEQSDVIQVVLLANNETAQLEVTEHDLAQVIPYGKKRSLFSFDMNDRHEKKESDKSVELRAFITSEDRSVSYHSSQGLSAVGTFQGATRWIAFSSPTERNQRVYTFFYDAFVDLSATNGLDGWTISLCNQKLPELKGFNKAAVYNMVTGKERGDGTQEKVTVFPFGASMDLSKGASPIGKRVKDGLELAFDRELSTGTLEGVVPQITTVDDEYTPSKTRAVVQDMMKKGIQVFIGSQGSASLESILDLIKQGEILVLFPFTGSPLFRTPDLRNLIHYRGSYIREGQELIKYALQDLKSKKVAVFYQDDEFGKGALEGARQELKQAGITDFIEVPHARNSLDYASQAAKIKDANPDTILFSTNTPAIRGLIRQLGVEYFSGKKLLGLSVYEDAFERFLKDKGLNFVLIRMVPDPKTSDLQIAKEYREWADKKNIPYDKVAFEQFINATILFHIMQKIEGPITQEKIIAVAEQFDNEPFKGLVLNFNPQTRELSDTLWIDSGVGPWIERRAEKQEESKLATPQIALKSLKERSELEYGSAIDLSKGLRELGKAVKDGIAIRLKQAADQGMQNVPEITIVDDGYTPSQTRKIVEEFIKKGIHLLVCPTGSPTLESYMDLVNDGRVTVLFAITGAPQFYKRSLTNLINLRPSYAAEGHVLTQYALTTLKARKFALFYQNDAFGRGLLEASKVLLKQKEITEILDVPYDRNEERFESQAKRTIAFDPDVILFFSTALAARSFIEQMGIPFVQKKELLGNSDLGEVEFQAFIQEQSLPFKYVSVVPNPKTSDLQIAQEFRDAAQKNNVPLDTFSFESYIGVDILLHVLQRMKKPISRNEIIEALSAIKESDYKGLELSFDPQTRTLLHSLWMNTGVSQWEKIPVSTGSKKG